MRNPIIQSSIDRHRQMIDAILANETLMDQIQQVADLMSSCLEKGGGIYLCGNGGSASDAQHIAAELSGRFKIDRKPLRAEALHTNSSFVTAVANDYGFEHIYSRGIEALGRKGDLLIALSTSGSSTNVVNGLIKANDIGIETVGLTGPSDAMDAHCTICLKVPSQETARIQEAHILIGHILCEIVETNMFR